MKRFFRNQKGGASLELCLVTPILLFMFIAIFDLGFLLYFQSQVTVAADAGALYALRLRPGGFDATKVAAATTGASYPITVSATPAPYMACGCPNGTTDLTVSTSPAAPACGGACPDGTTAATYAVVSAQASTVSIFNWFGGFPSQVNSAVVMRLQ
jgi:Flp pilus assembly protein TadG